MKLKITRLAALAFLLLAACGTSQKVTSSWINSEALKQHTGKYTKIFIASLSQNQRVKDVVENAFADKARSKGYEVVLSHDVFPPNFTRENAPDRETMMSKIRELGCDAIFTIGVVDRTSETRYVPGSAAYSPFPQYRGAFWGYYTYWYPLMYQPGYYATDKTYFLEANLFDVATENLVWSVQSEAYNPGDIKKESQRYADLIVEQAEKDFKH